MSKYDGSLDSILVATLDKYALQDFRLVEYDDHIVVLYHSNEEIFRALQTSAKLTPAFIQCECEAHLTAKHGVYV